jgi:hypothetical protein
MDAPLFTDADLIHRYTRSDAIRDGVLVDATERASRVGLRFPVALTAAVYASCVTWTGPECVQSEPGRMGALLLGLRRAILTSADGDTARYQLNVLQADLSVETVDLYAVCGPGDHGEPVITLMLDGED